MPSIAVFMPADRLAVREADMAQFLASALALCTDVMAAAADKVQILLVPILGRLHGKPGYIEVKFREASYRDATTVDHFMAALDELSQRYFSCQPRIRCFGYGSDNLFARN